MSLVHSQPYSGAYANRHQQQAASTALKSQLSSQPLTFSATKLAAPAVDPLTLQRHANTPKFGCRLFGFISAKPEPQQGELLNELFYHGENSLKSQSEMKPDESRFPRNWERHMADIRFPNGMYIDGRNNDGSGRAYFHQDGTMSVPKSPFPFTEDRDLEIEMENIRQTPPKAMMLHLRDAASLTNSAEAKEENTHPFRLGDMAMIHNGTLPPNTVFWLDKQIARHHRKYPEIPLPKGTSDSERAFLYMMGRLREKEGAIDAAKLSTKALEDVFQETLLRLDYLNNRPGNVMHIVHSKHFADDTGFSANDGKLLLPYGMNFIWSDGKRILASRYNRSLHVASIRNAKNKAQAALFSTYPIQPSQGSGFKKLNWWEVPERAMITVEPGKDETINSRIKLFEDEHNPFAPSFLWWRLKTAIQLLPVTIKMIRARFKGQNGYQLK